MKEERENNVYALGRVADLNGAPIENVVTELRVLLGRAERGEVVGFAYAYVDGGGFTNTGWEIGTSEAAKLCAAVGLLSYKVFASWDQAPGGAIFDPPNDRA
jgi:hypothetical protein